MNPRMLVTGGIGFIAAWCIAQLIEAEHEVVATVRAPEREREVREAVEAHCGATPRRDPPSPAWFTSSAHPERDAD